MAFDASSYDGYPGDASTGDSPAGRPDADGRPLFECEDFRRVAGETLRPGGLALTGRILDLCHEDGLLPPGALALDLGCGEGATARFLAARGLRVLALDISAPMLRQTAGKAAPQALPVQARAQALPLQNASLDAVFCECVLSATGECAAVLQEIARALKPGGLLALTDLYLRGGGPPPRAGVGGCLSGALPWEDMDFCLRAAGLHTLRFEDHSRLLAELAGRLIFAGLSPAGLGFSGHPPREDALRDHANASSPLGGFVRGAAGDTGTGGKARPGYFLCLAQKPADGLGS